MNAVAIKRVIFLLLGLACICAMLRPPFFGSLAAGSTPDPAILRIVYDATTLFWGLALVALSKVMNAWRAACVRLAMLSAGAVASVGVLLIAISYALELSILFLCLVGVVLVSLGFAALVAGWFYLLSLFSRKHIATLVFGAYVFSHLFGLLDMLPRTEAAFVSAGYPLLSSVMLVFCMRLYGKSPQVLVGARNSHTVQPKNTLFCRLRFFVLLMVFIEVLCGAMLRSGYADGGVNYQVGSHTVATYLASACIGLVLLLAVRKTKSTTEGAIVVGGIGLVCMLLCSLLYNEVSIYSLVPFITSIYSALVIYMMVLIELWVQDGDRKNLLCAGVFLLLYAAATILTTSIVPQFFSLFLGEAPREHISLIAVIAGLVISFAVCITLLVIVTLQRESFLKALASDKAEEQEEYTAAISGSTSNLTQSATRSSIQNATQTSAPNALDTASHSASLHERAIEYLAEHYHLTERERQTASLLAKGYTARRVSEKLVVTVGTVQGYCKSIYRKLNIHRKDELIEEVNRVKSTLNKEENPAP